MTLRTKQSARAYSLLELLATVAIVGLLAGVLLVNFRPTFDGTNQRACYVTKGEIELQVRLWYRDKGVWPQANLADIGEDPLYFPQGLPTCPAGAAPYTLDPATHRVVGHTH